MNQVKDIADMPIGARIAGDFVANNIEIKPFKQKKGIFLQFDLIDKTGSVKAILWEGAEGCKEWLRNKMPVEVTGEKNQYNGVSQFIVKTIVKLEECDPSLFVPALEQKCISEFKRCLDTIGGGLSNEIYKKVWNYITCPSPIYNLFYQCPGGVGDVHHAYVGGLVEHTYGLINMAWSMLQHPAPGDLIYGIDSELLLTGCLVHDIGKIRAYNWSVSIDMNDVGRLIHHVPLGVLELEAIVRATNIEMPCTEVYKLMHIIVSHHSDLENLRKPMFPEAVMVARLDALNADEHFALSYVANKDNAVPGENWTQFCKLTERRYYIPQKEIPEEVAAVVNEGKAIAPNAEPY